MKEGLIILKPIRFPLINLTIRHGMKLYFDPVDEWDYNNVKYIK